MNINFIIPLHNPDPGEEQFLLDLTKKLSEYKNCSVNIISNQANTDYENRFAKVIKVKHGIGFARSVNLGIYLSGYDENDLLVILNQDVIFPLSALELFIQLEEQFQAGNIYSPLIIHSQTKEDLNIDRTITELQLKASKQFPGAFLVFRRSLIRQLGGFDPLFYHYGEDFDFKERALRSGVGLFIVNSIKIFHPLWTPYDLNHKSKRRDFLFFRAQLIKCFRYHTRNPIAQYLSACKVFIRKGYFRPIIQLGQFLIHCLLKEKEIKSIDNQLIKIRIKSWLEIDKNSILPDNGKLPK